MASDKVIQIEDLRRVVNGIFDHLQDELDIKTITLEEDYFNDIPLSEVFQVGEDKPNTVLGQLYDDWEFLEGLLKDKDERVSLMFDHVAPILRYIAYKIGQ